MKKCLYLTLIILFYITNFQAQCWLKLSSNHEHALAIKADSSLWQWGGNLYSFERALRTPTLINSLDNWIEVSTGKGFYAAIKTDGTLWTWGENTYGQVGNGTTTNLWTPTQLGTESNWLKIECGSDFMLAIKNDGTIWTWGKNRTSSPTQIETDTDWVKIYSGTNKSFGIKSDLSLWQLLPTSASLFSNSQWETVSLGNSQNHGIKVDGTLWEWGNGLPSQVGAESNWKKSSDSHSNHSLFIKTDGTLWGAGYNLFGQVGVGSIINVTSPTQIGTDNNWLSINAGDNYSLALKTNRSLWAWGKNNHAQFGNGKNKNRPQPVDTTTHWKVASSSSAYQSGHTLAIKDNGTLWAWGQNNDGQLGNGTTYSNKLLPTQITSDSNWFSISNGFFFSVATKTDGTLWTWGRNGRGQLGIGSSTFKKTVPTKIGNDSTWSAVSAGSEFVIALKNNGTLWAWGYNYNGQLGNGNTTTQHTPIQIGLDSTWVFISAGNKHSFGIKSDSTLWSWGSNQHGQLGRGGNSRVPIQVGTDKWKAVSGGGMHSIGVKTDSTLWSWGRNLYAQLGTGSTSNKSMPYQIDTLHHWNNVAAGYEHSVATKLDSSLWGWGRNNGGQVGDTNSYPVFLSKTFTPTKISHDNNWGTINAGPINSTAMKSNGNLYTYGGGYSSTYNTNFPLFGYIFSTPQRVSNCSFCPPSVVTVNESICSGDTILFNGEDLTLAGEYIDTLTNSSGCDSIITLVITNNQSYDSITEHSCNSYTAPSGKFYTTSGTFNDTIPNSFGCDSIITITLLFNQSYDTITVNECQTYTSPSGRTLISSGTYSDTITNYLGCDSIININLNINQSYNTINESACFEYLSPSGKTYLTSGTYTDTVINHIGCDSIITIELLVDQINTSITQSGVHLSANDNNVSYQWINCNTNQAILNATLQDFTANSNGNYAVELSSITCIDTSDCILVNSVDIEKYNHSSFKIYPNPTLNSFVIKLQQGKTKGIITIYDITGKIVYNHILNTTSLSIPDNILLPGVYTIQLEENSNYSYEKLIKN